MEARGSSGRALNALFLLIFLGATCTLPALQAQAVLVGTEAILEPERGAKVRGLPSSALGRVEVREALEAQGVPPEEAEVRLQNLSDTEILEIAERLDELPAGGGTGEVVVAVLVVFAILVILDATGVTDVFPWIPKKP